MSGPKSKFRLQVLISNGTRFLTLAEGNISIQELRENIKTKHQKIYGASA